MALDSLVHPAPLDSVFVHGAGETSLLWTRLLSNLSGGGTAYAVNLPGHPYGEPECHSIGEYSESVLAFMREKDLKPAVIGHSMGGGVALQLALDHPEDVAGLVLLSTGAKLGVLPEILSGLESNPLSVIERKITPMSFYSLDLQTARLARDALALSNQKIFLNDYLACSKFDIRNRLHEITTKTLIICGENDMLTPPKWSHFLHQNIPGSKLHIIREAGHMLPLEKPELCSRLIQSFLVEISR